MNLLVIISFLSTILNIPYAIALYLGLKLQIEDPNCAEDVKNTKDNIRNIKIIQTINAIISLCILIISAILNI